MDYRNYLASTTETKKETLEDWRWLIGPQLQLWFVTKAGDVLLRNSSNDSIHYLDVTAGIVEQIATSRANFESRICDVENAGLWLKPEIVDGQALLDMRPAKNQCLSFIHPPILGGQIHPDNFEICDILVHLSISGQILRQVKDLPPGTEIADIKIQEPGKSGKRSWWRFW